MKFSFVCFHAYLGYFLIHALSDVLFIRGIWGDLGEGK